MTTATRTRTIRVDDTDYHWSVHRLPRWVTGGAHEPELLGLAVLVRLPGADRRELRLEFDIDRTRHGDMPQHQRFHLPDGRLSEAIRSARTAGWVPDSRGRCFVHAAGALQPR